MNKEFSPKHDEHYECRQCDHVVFAEPEGPCTECGDDAWWFIDFDEIQERKLEGAADRQLEDKKQGYHS